MLSTRLTERFDLRYPIVSAPMSLHSGGRLAGAVSAAGGLGLFGGIQADGESGLRREIALARELSAGRPFGVGFITHLLSRFGGFDTVLDERVPVLTLSFADPTPWVGRAKDRGLTVMCQVQSPAGAELAVNAGADMLVAQGNEAGGHTGTANLLPLLNRLVRDHPDLPVLAAGGIGDGAGLAAVLAAGADGAWLGTVFLATPECVEVPEGYKARVVKARSEDTVYTRVFDVLDERAHDIPPWPEGIAARVIGNPLLARWHGREGELTAELVSVYRDARARGDLEASALYAGQSVDGVHAVRPAAAVIADICAQAEGRIAALQSMRVEPGS